MKFKSQFLNDQLANGNIQIGTSQICRDGILVQTSSLLKCEGNKKDFKDKITKQLKREGYSYVAFCDLYSKTRKLNFILKV